MNDLLVILTVRTGSERLPAKMLASVAGVPLVSWVIERWLQLGCRFCMATTALAEDDELAEVAGAQGVPVFRYDGDPNDVLGRMEAARAAWFPEVRFVMRGLGDCPWACRRIVRRAVEVMREHKAETFNWMLPPEALPLYGCREFPYHLNAWQRLIKNASGQEREHVDRWFCQNRGRFRTCYHEPPPSAYFRPDYRVEIDWPEDLMLAEAVAHGPGMLAPLAEIVSFLDGNSEVASLNQGRTEKTGPLVSYTHAERREWFRLMRGKPVVDWDDRVWQPPHARALPQFCQSGRCLVGFGHQGQLYTKEGHIIAGRARLNCNCGTGRVWREEKIRI